MSDILSVLYSLHTKQSVQGEEIPPLEPVKSFGGMTWPPPSLGAIRVIIQNDIHLQLHLPELIYVVFVPISGNHLAMYLVALFVGIKIMLA